MKIPMENTKICLLSSIYMGRRGEKDKINLGCVLILTKKKFTVAQDEI